MENIYIHLFKFHEEKLYKSFAHVQIVHTGCLSNWLFFLGYQGCQKQTEHHSNLESNEITTGSRWTSSQILCLCLDYQWHLTEHLWRHPITPPPHVRDFSAIIIAIRNNSAWICNTDISNRRRQTNQGYHPTQCFCWNRTVFWELCLPPEHCFA